MTSIIDTHAHLDFDIFAPDLNEVIARARQTNVEAVINVGASLGGSQKSIELAQKYDFVYAAVGIHPEGMESFSLPILESLARSPKVVAIGEIGLDYHYTDSFSQKRFPASKQQDMFNRQLELAEKLDLPVIIHSREAFDDTLTILNKHHVRAVFHCWTYTLTEALRAIEAGYFLSFTAIVTYPNAGSIQEVAKIMPLDKFWFDTDSPLLAPQAYRGQRNEPSYVWEIAGKIAELRAMDTSALAETTTENARRFFNLT